MQTIKVVAGSLLALACVLALGFGLRYFGVISYEFFGKKYADADREIFEESKPFIHGSIQNLYKMKFEYETADTPQHKMAIRQTVFAQIAGLDKQHLPHDLQVWLNTISNAPVQAHTTVTH